MIKVLISEAIFLPIFWLLVFSFITAVGYALIPFKNQPGRLSSNLFSNFWYGLGLCIVFLQIWNLFFPVNYYSWVFLLPIAIYGGINSFRAKLFVNVKFPGIIPSILFAFILIFLVVSSLDNAFNYDTLAYQFYSIKWINSYPATKGLGNLYCLMAYNQSYFLLPAFLNSIWTNYKGACATNGLLAIVICSEIVFRNAKYLIGKEKINFFAAFQLLFLPLCINIGIQNLTSPYPDVAVNLLTFKVLSDLIYCIEAKKLVFQDLFLIAFYCVLGIIMKVSFAGIAIGCFLVIFSFLFVKGLWKLSSTLKVIFIFSLLLIPWSLRGIISSGYIGYPLSTFGFPVDWKMPPNIVNGLSDYTVGFSRTHVHGSVAMAAAHGYAWLPGWIKIMLTTFGFDLPILIFLGVCIIAKFKNISLTNLFIILVPVFVSIIFWLVTAPDLRFVVFTFWGLGLSSLAYLIVALKHAWVKHFPLFICICSIVVMIRNWNTNPKPLGDLPKQKFTTFSTRSGLKLKYITGNPANDEWQISDCTIPCTAFRDTDIMLRGESIEGGFKRFSDYKK